MAAAPMAAVVVLGIEGVGVMILLFGVLGSRRAGGACPGPLLPPL